MIVLLKSKFIDYRNETLNRLLHFDSLFGTKYKQKRLIDRCRYYDSDFHLSYLNDLNSNEIIRFKKNWLITSLIIVLIQVIVYFINCVGWGIFSFSILYSWGFTLSTTIFVLSALTCILTIGIIGNYLDCLKERSFSVYNYTHIFQIQKKFKPLPSNLYSEVNSKDLFALYLREFEEETSIQQLGIETKLAIPLFGRRTFEFGNLRILKILLNISRKAIQVVTLTNILAPIPVEKLINLFPHTNDWKTEILKLMNNAKLIILNFSVDTKTRIYFEVPGMSPHDKQPTAGLKTEISFIESNQLYTKTLLLLKKEDHKYFLKIAKYPEKFFNILVIPQFWMPIWASIMLLISCVLPLFLISLIGYKAIYISFIFSIPSIIFLSYSVLKKHYFFVKLRSTIIKFI